MTNPQPQIDYGIITGQPMHSNLQYLAYKAGLSNGTYTAQQFINAIDAVSLDIIPKAECQRDLQNQKAAVRIMAKNTSTVTIRNFNPDVAALENFVNTTFDEMRTNLYR